MSGVLLLVSLALIVYLGAVMLCPDKF
ncbi:potassium-transporting ATPase subunit F [Zobellella sp. DQSA1]